MDDRHAGPDCPSHAQLAAFEVGNLSSDELERVAQHVADCQDCVSVLQSVAAADDPLLEGLRIPTAPDAYEREADCLEALKAAQSIGSDIPSADASFGTPDLAQLRDYRILQRIDSGGMGVVYKAEHVRLKRTVALKVMTHARMADKQAIDRFCREMEAIGRLDHQNIVRATDAGEEDGLLYLVMEHVEGCDLDRLLQQTGPLPIPETCEIIRQAALGLQHAYEHKLVHRDLKPANLMITTDGRVKLLDLGLALLRETQVFGRELTEAGSVLGTLDYMAPEQARDTHLVDIRADLYSLGATLYKLLTGEPPFAGPQFATPVQKILAHATEPVPDIQHRRPETPSQLVSLLGDLLAKSPDARLATPLALVQALTPLSVGADLKSQMAAGALQARTDRSTAESVKSAESPPVPCDRAAALPEPQADARETNAAAVPRADDRILPVGRLWVATGIVAIVAFAFFFVRSILPQFDSTGDPPLDSPSQNQNWVELSDSVDPSRDTVAGQWTLDPEGLTSDLTAYARVQLPFNPPAQFDFLIEFSAVTGQEAPLGEVFQVFPVDGESVRWAMWCFDYSHFGFVWNDGSFDSSNPTFQVADEPLRPGRRYVSVVQVRDDSVVALLDGRLIASWDRQRSGTGTLTETALNDPWRLGVGSYQSRVVFHRIAILAVP